MFDSQLRRMTARLSSRTKCTWRRGREGDLREARDCHGNGKTIDEGKNWESKHFDNDTFKSVCCVSQLKHYRHPTKHHHIYVSVKCETLEAVFIYGYTRKKFSLGFCWTWPPPAWWRLSDVFPRDEEIPEKARGTDKEVEGRKFASCIYWKRETDKQETRTSVTTEESASQSQKTNRGLFTFAQMTTQISPQHSVQHSVCYWFVSVSVRLCDSPEIISALTSGKGLTW